MAKQKNIITEFRNYPLRVEFPILHHMAASVWYSWTTNLRKVMPAVNG